MSLNARIEALEAALANVTLETDPMMWARLKSALGNAHTDNPTGDGIDNIERGIRHMEEALTVISPHSDARAWSQLRNNLGTVYVRRQTGDPAENIETAIACYRDALTIATASADPRSWAQICNNLGAAFAQRRTGVKADNMEYAIDWYRNALRVRTPSTDRAGWLQTTNNLASACRQRLRGEPADNFRHAIALYQDVLNVRSRDKDPRGWANTCNNLGNLYRELPYGDRAQNLEQARACFEHALEVRTPTDDARGWAQTQSNLGHVYRIRLQGDRADNLERAIACYASALKVRTRAADTKGWTLATNSLGNVYRERLRGERAANLERAIACYSSALDAVTAQSDAHSWAVICNNLGAAYSEREKDSRAENLEQAIAWYQRALTVRTRDADARGWAESRNNLGSAYGERLHGKKAENIECAIRCFEDALTVRTAERDIRGFAASSHNLAAVLADRQVGETKGNLERAVVLLRTAARAGARSLQPLQLIQVRRREALYLMRLGTDRWPEAAAALDEARALFAAQHGTAVTPAARRDLLAALSDVGRWSAFIAVAAGDVGAGLEKLEASRALGLRESLALDESLSVSMDAAARRTIEDARRRVALLRAEAALPAGTSGERAYPQVAEALAVAMRGLADALSAAGVVSELPMPIDRLLQAIPPSRVLIVPVATEFGGLVFVVPGGTATLTDGHVVRCRHLTEEHVRVQLTAWRQAYAAMMHAYEQKDICLPERWKAASDVLDGVLSWLWEAVMSPAMACLQQHADEQDLAHLSAAELLIMPTGDFSLLPLHAASRDLDGRRRAVLDDMTVAYTASLHAARDAHRKEAGRAPSDRRVLALLNPTLDLTWSERLEGVALAQLFTDEGKREILVGKDATRVALRERAPGCGYLHLSCHASFDRRDPLASGLTLAADERLRLAEVVAELNLARCRWVMLTACETGMIDVDRTPEEVVGLPAAFQEAGAACVAATLWSVADEATALFVEQAYRAHLQDRLAPAQAAREAALYVRDLTQQSHGEADVFVAGRQRFVRLGDDALSPGPPRAQRPFRSPLFWAPFTCWGA